MLGQRVQLMTGYIYCKIKMNSSETNENGRMDMIGTAKATKDVVF